MPRACVGMRSSTPGVKSTCVHQQGPWGWPVVFSLSMAQLLGLPHSGQQRGSQAGGVGVLGMASVGVAIGECFQGV